MRSADLTAMIALAQEAYDAERRNIRDHYLILVDRRYFIFLYDRLGLFFFIFLCLFELLGEEALTITVHIWVGFIDAELIGDHLLIQLIVCAQA